MNRREFLTTAALAAAGALLADAASAQPAAGEASFAFAVIADPHLREDKPGEAPAAEKLRAVLAALAALPQRPDFLLMLGDLHPEKLVPLLPEITRPLHVVHGNHESAAHRQQIRELFPQDFAGRDFYAFTHKGCRFIGLCTALVGDHLGHFESEDITPPTGQMEWLQEELRQNANMPRFVYAHIPPEPDNKPNSTYLGSLESKWLHDLVAKEQPTACFFGHRHLRQEYQCGSTPMHLVPSCNWNFGTHKRGFYLVTVEATGSRIEFREV